MIIVLKRESTRDELAALVRWLADRGAAAYVADRGARTIEVLGAGNNLDRRQIERMSGVDRVLDGHFQVLQATRRSPGETREVCLGPRATIGGRGVAVIAGPCSVEDESCLLETAAAVAEAGAKGLRGGAFKPRTSPFAFQGLGRRGLDMLYRVREKTGLAVVTEVMSCEQIAAVREVADVLQVGSRNMHNTPLLRALGEQDKPILLKRGWSATLEELLLAAEYVGAGGNNQVILCERGIRTFEDYVRNTLALAVVPEAKRLSHHPIIVDPSHGTGRAHLVAPMCHAALAAGADGLLIEVHPSPAQAWSDGAQTIDLDEFGRLMRSLRVLAAACDREL